MTSTMPATPPPLDLPHALPEREGIGAEEARLGAEFRARYASQVEGIVVHRAVPDPRVTLVIVSFRASDYLLACLRHLRAQTAALQVPYEILLADSGGLEHLRERYGNLVDVELRLRDGLPLNVARNAAMGHARGELVAYIDDDGLVEPDWVEQALAVFEDAGVGAARGRIVPHEHPYLTAYAGHYDRGDALWDEGNVSTEGNMMIRRAVYLAIGGFPDALYGLEGLYLAYRMTRVFPGLRSVYAPGMTMRHDYCRSVREFVWKCRKYRDLHASTTENDPEFRRYLDAYMRKRKPAPKRTPGERLARRAMRAAEWAITRLPIFDHVSRR
jgi:glycosyltransferase involved in cell wall biosynthesis